MRNVACLSIYNDRSFLSSCLESIIEADCFDTLIVADGAYRLYFEEYRMHDSKARPWSSDGSMEIVQAFKDLPDLRILKPPQGAPNSGLEYDCWENQAVKRTALIEAVADGDWFTIIDADEMLMGDVQEGYEKIFGSDCVVASCPLWLPGSDVDRYWREWHPRFFRKVPGMHYKGTHWHLKDRVDRVIEETYPVYWTDTLCLVHLKGLKPQSRMIPHQNYMAQLANRGWLEPEELGKILWKQPILSGR